MTKSTGLFLIGASISLAIPLKMQLSKRKRNSSARKEQHQPGVLIPISTEKLVLMDSDTTGSFKLARTARDQTTLLSVDLKSMDVLFVEDGHVLFLLALENSFIVSNI